MIAVQMRRVVAAAGSALVLLLVSASAAEQTPVQATPPPSQKEAPPTGAVSGVVIDGTTGQPVADAIVALGGAAMPASSQSRVLTDARGRFVFSNVPDSENLQLTVTKFGFFDGGYGREWAPTGQLRPIVIRSGNWIANLKVPIWRPGTVAGHVRDENGDPVVGVFVRALVRVHVAGREMLAAGPMTTTDDRGSYRLFGLSPGRYVIQVPSVHMSMPSSTRVSAPASNTPEGALDVLDGLRLVIGRYPLPPPARGGRRMSYPPAFHPNAAAVADAAIVDLKFGEERNGVDVTLTPTPAVTVSGIVDGPAEALVGLTLRLLPVGLDELGLGSETATALVGADGSFTFYNVPAGNYILEAPVFFHELKQSIGSGFSGGSVGFAPNQSFPTPPPYSGWSRTGHSVESHPGLSMTTSDFRSGKGGAHSARLPLTVGAADMSGVAVRLRAHSTMEGRIVVEADPVSSKTPPAEWNLMLDPAGARPSLGLPRGQATGPRQEFRIPGVQPGQYWLRIQYPTGWLVKSVQWRGRDYTNTPLDTEAADDLTGVVVTITNVLPTVVGAVRSADGSLPDAGIIVAFPVDPDLRLNTGFSTHRFRKAPLQSDGRYRLTNLPAGDYFVAALDRERAGSWPEPAFLDTLSRSASRVTLSWGQTVTQDLVIR
jgi:hypothetical protein